MFCVEAFFNSINIIYELRKRHKSYSYLTDIESLMPVSAVNLN